MTGWWLLAVHLGAALWVIWALVKLASIRRSLAAVKAGVMAEIEFEDRRVVDMAAYRGMPTAPRAAFMPDAEERN